MDKIKINYPRDKFINELKNYIEEGRNLSEKFKGLSITSEQLKLLERKLRFWDDEVQLFLEKRLETFIPSQNKYLNDFKSVFQGDYNSLIKIIFGEKVDIIHSNYEHLISCIQRKTDILISLERNSKFMDISENFRDTIIKKNRIRNEGNIYKSFKS